MGFTFQKDTNNLAGSVAPYRSGNSFFTPESDVAAQFTLLTSSVLGASATYTQTQQSRLDGGLLIDRVRAVVDADQGGTLFIEESYDGSTWVTASGTGAQYTITANQELDTGFVLLTRLYYRFRLVNGSTAQTRLNLYQTQAGGSQAVHLGMATPVLLRNCNNTPQFAKQLPGRLVGLQILNNQAAAVYIQVFDAAASGSITLGTTVPVMEILVAANAHLNVPINSKGVQFRLGIGMCSTTTEYGSTGSAAGVHVNVQYE